MMRFSLLSLCALRPARGFAAAALRARRPRAAPRVARFSVSGAVWEARGASAPVVELFTKEGCTLCDEAKAVLASCRDDADHALTAVDITDPDKKRWLAKYKRGPGAGGSSRPTAFARAQVRHPGPARRRAVLDEAPRYRKRGPRCSHGGRLWIIQGAPGRARRVAARAMGYRSKVPDPNETVQITRSVSLSPSESLSFDDFAREGTQGDEECEVESFNALEGVLGVMLAILSRPQSAAAWKLSAPILNSLLREHRKVLMASLHQRKDNVPIEDYPPKPAKAPGVSPYAFLQGAAIAVFKAAARPPPTRDLAVASLRTMLEAAVDIFGTSEQLCPTLIYAMHAAFFPLRPISCADGVAISLEALKSGNEVSPAGWNNSVKETLQTLQYAEICIRKLANATMNPSSMFDVSCAVELESSLALALKSSPAAHVKVLHSLSNRLAANEHWVEAAEASTAAGIIAMQAFSIAAPTLCVWFDHDVQSLRDSFFALPDGASPVPAVAGIRCGTEEISEAQILTLSLIHI